MSTCKLVLIPSYTKGKLEISMNEQEPILYNSNKIDYNSYVYAEDHYSAQLLNINIDDNTIIDFYVNDDKIKCRLDGNNITFNDDCYGNMIFRDCYGFVKLCIYMQNGDKDTILYSNNVPVLVKNNSKNQSIHNMVRYIYKYGEKFLYDDYKSTEDLSGLKSSGDANTEVQIEILKLLIKTYMENFIWFKTNSKFKIINEEKVDKFEKIKYISQNTIRYIILHPNELTPINHNSGIRINNKQFEPKHTLVTNNIYSFDIYENEIIVSFLKYILGEINNINDNIDNEITKVENIPKTINGYIVSPYNMYSGIRFKLEQYKKELSILSDQIEEIYYRYKNTLHVSYRRITKIPKPTAIFMSIPHYRKIYDIIIKWFNFGRYNLENEKFILSFLRADKLYEYYVLLRLNKFFLNKGYNIKEKRKYSYSFAYKSRYVNTFRNNTFIYDKQNIRITIFYQPVVFSGNIPNQNNIFLFRNTNLSFGDTSKGYYYTPDYIIKIEQDEKTRYILMDAKFSDIYTVKKYIMPNIVFKYMFSISKIYDKDKIDGICIINGQSNTGENNLEDIYNTKSSIRKCDIKPYFDLMTLTGNEDSDNILEDFWRKYTDGLK